MVAPTFCVLLVGTAIVLQVAALAGRICLHRYAPAGLLLLYMHMSTSISKLMCCNCAKLHPLHSCTDTDTPEEDAPLLRVGYKLAEEVGRPLRIAFRRANARWACQKLLIGSSFGCSMAGHGYHIISNRNTGAFEASKRDIECASLPHAGLSGDPS